MKLARTGRQRLSDMRAMGESGWGAQSSRLRRSKNFEAGRAPKPDAQPQAMGRNAVSDGLPTSSLFDLTGARRLKKNPELS